MLTILKSAPEHYMYHASAFDLARSLSVEDAEKLVFQNSPSISIRYLRAVVTCR